MNVLGTRFILGVYIQRKTGYIGFGTIHGFGHSLVVLECVPHRRWVTIV